MNRLIPFILVVFILSGCSISKKIDWSNSFWGELLSEELYLYKENDSNSLVENSVIKGSILYFHKTKGDYREVYTRNLQTVKSKYRNKYRFYLYKPNYRKLDYHYTKSKDSIHEVPYDINKTYLTGPRGGCYYMNSQGNKTYVNRHYCNELFYPTTTVKTNRTYSRKSSKCNTVQCSGRTQKGARCKNKTTNCSGRCHLH